MDAYDYTRKDIDALSYFTIGNTVYVYYFVQAENTTVYLTSFEFGGSSKGKTFLIYNGTKTTTPYDQNLLRSAVGKALPSNQTLALVTDRNLLLESIVEVNQGVIKTIEVQNFNSSMDCDPFVAEKDHYGTFCVNKNKSNWNMTQSMFFVRTGTSNKLVNFANITGNYRSFHLNGSNLVIIFKQEWLTNHGDFMFNLSYVIYDIKTLTIVKDFPDFMVCDSATDVKFKALPSGGVYALAYGIDATGKITGNLHYHITITTVIPPFNDSISHEYNQADNTSHTNNKISFEQLSSIEFLADI